MNRQAVLIVEDDPVLRRLTSKQVSQLGYRCEVVGTGEEAVAFDKSEIGLILMDIGLPGMDGVAAAMNIRQKEVESSEKRIPIVALTAHSERHDCMNAGIDEILHKPALLEDIRSTLERFMADNDASENRASRLP